MGTVPANTQRGIRIVKMHKARAQLDVNDSDASESHGNHGDLFMRPEAAAKFLQVTKNYLAQLRVRGGDETPPFYRPEGTTLILYRRSDLIAWLGQPRRSTLRTPAQPKGND